MRYAYCTRWLIASWIAIFELEGFQRSHVAKKTHLEVELMFPACAVGHLDGFKPDIFESIQAWIFATSALSWA
jgi:hypothetical protein